MTMSAAEAKQFLQLFLANTPGRLEELGRRVVADGAAREEQLDLGPDALDLVWEWARPQLAWREGYVPPPLGQPGPRGPVGDLEPPDQLPEWFDPPVYDWWQFSASTLWLIDGLARYLGESLLEAVPGSRWTVGRSRTKGYVYQNHPVIAGLPLGDDLEPMTVVTVLLSKALRGEPWPLRRMYDTWAGIVKI
ncbi:hypothetical protein [Cellulomonas fimi]|uniref:Uncharacterized protein n=1 Tax=Cellulomonas fimi TaxID=1708 RepID=A0A7Y0LYF0_CELFI|nr:hypothetical protein [Cellulomonas fimi]NMR20486.1 hypothetical protein [Cellulomonas fimi]